MIDDSRVRTWRHLLRGAAGLNLLFWAYAASVAASPDQRMQLWLSGIYVAGCAYRSIFPVVYVKRFVLEAGLTSSILVGRVVATIAEVALALQLALLLQQWSSRSGIAFVSTAGFVTLACLCTAQCFCWYGVATLRYLGELIEESLWTLGVAVLFVAAVAMAYRQGFWPETGVVLSLITGGAFLSFMLGHNLPMYVQRIRASRGQSGTLSFAAGLRDMLQRRHVSYRWDDWKGEIAWLTPYFTAGVWLSIGMVLLS